MAKYHISKSGDPAVCNATVKACPIGGPDSHYDSAEAARAAFEASMGGGTASLSRDDELAAAYDETVPLYSKPAEPSREDLMRAGAWAKKNNRFCVAGFKEEGGKVVTPAYQDYDGTGVFYETVGQKTFIVATPSGEFVKVEFHGGVDGEIDNGWEYSPQLQFRSSLYTSASAVRADKAEAQHQEDLSFEGENQYLRSRTTYSDSPSYSHHDLHDVKNAVRTLMNAYAGSPWDATYATLLHHSKKKLKPSSVVAWSKSPHAYVREAAAGRKELPKAEHARLASDPETGVRYALSRRTDLNDATVESLLTAPTDRFYLKYELERAAYSSPSASARLQKKWAKSIELQGLRNLAENPALDPEAKAIIQKRTEGLGVRFYWAR